MTLLAQSVHIYLTVGNHEPTGVSTVGSQEEKEKWRERKRERESRKYGLLSSSAIVCVV